MLFYLILFNAKSTINFIVLFAILFLIIGYKSYFTIGIEVNLFFPLTDRFSIII